LDIASAMRCQCWQLTRSSERMKMWFGLPSHLLSLKSEESNGIPIQRQYCSTPAFTPEGIVVASFVID